MRLKVITRVGFTVLTIGATLFYINVSVSGIAWSSLAKRLMKDPLRTTKAVLLQSEIGWLVVKIQLTFAALLVLLDCMPGPRRCGVMSLNGHMPVYVENGVAQLGLFTLFFIHGALKDHYPLSILHDNLQPLICLLNVIAFGTSLFLYIKGRIYPSAADVTHAKVNVCRDFYAGIELHPRILGFDVKKLLCRFSMTFWMLSSISTVDASYRKHGKLDYGLAANAITTGVYIVMFFVGEIGYLRSFSIIEENVGFWYTWRHLVLFPVLHTNHLHFSVRRPTQLLALQASLLGVSNIACTLLVFWANRQRQLFRDTNGRRLLWWPRSPRSLRMSYRVNRDSYIETRESLFLTNGLWGIVRHPQYIFEIGTALTWGLLANPLIHGAQPMHYFVFLTIFMMYRAHRDMLRCRAKYGDQYLIYVANVPYMIVPRVY